MPEAHLQATRVLETFLDLVRIDSPSREEADCAAYCARALEEAGCVVRFDGAAELTGSNTGNLIAELPGDGRGVLVLSAHLDTVEPCRGVEPVIFEGIVVSAGETILGADDKAGLAAAIECVRRLSEDSEPSPTVRCVFTVQEEVGLVGAKALAEADVKGDLCVVLDADGAPGGIVIAAPTHYTFEAVFEGRASHAGVAPEHGISAIAMAADAIGRMRIGRLDAETTANVGSIAGGGATNVIAAHTRTTGECRSLDRAKAEETRERMDAVMKAAASDAGGKVDVVWTLEYEGFRLSPDDGAVALARAAAADVGLDPKNLETGGGSDANVIAALGVPTVALSCGMQGVHGTSEQLAVEDLESLTRLCVAAARRLAREGGGGT
jgi:tripeptide aminopeptidase